MTKVSKKWANRSAGASGDYSDGVQSTAKDWQGSAVAGGQNYRTAVTAAAAAGRFEKGVARVGTAKWRSNTLSKGPGRYSQGVQVAEGDFSTAMAPVLQTIGSIDLPARLPTGSDGNIQRVAAIAKGLRQMKVGK
ncbi:MAG TPA: hypothetical protein VIW78_04925 [Burkholderiales bacterium]